MSYGTKPLKKTETGDRQARDQKATWDAATMEKLLRRTVSFLGPLDLQYHTVAEQREARAIVQAILKFGRDEDDKRLFTLAPLIWSTLAGQEKK